MEIWVLLIILIRNKLDQAVIRAERKIMKVALNPTIDALKQSAQVCDLINNKNMLVNLKVLYDRIEMVLQGEKLDFIKEFLAIRDDVDEYCLKRRTTPSALIDKVLSFANEGSLPLKNLGITVGKMEEDYGSLTLVAMSMAALKRAVRQLRAKTPGMILAFRRNVEFNHALI